ncbi:hypothetical protein EVAR_50157_1 [Eumeta japonica]|uniref:Uncharacterized protein n=1 Tax=Eumeta variegata TaxID=151549 RepID=A0A4C1SFE7_EUMVA|nr:hypothetical protein EVAR_50157_1 [Eumeta japonica]
MPFRARTDDVSRSWMRLPDLGPRGHVVFGFPSIFPIFLKAGNGKIPRIFTIVANGADRLICRAPVFDHRNLDLVATRFSVIPDFLRNGMFGNSRIEYTCTGYRRAQTYPITVCVTDPVPELCPGEYVRAYLRFGFSWFPPKREAAGGSTMSQSTTLKGANRMTGSAPRLDVGIWDLVATRFPVFPDFRRNGPREKSRTRHNTAHRCSAPGDAKNVGSPIAFELHLRNTSAAASIPVFRRCGRTRNPEGARKASPGCPSGRAANGL